MKNNDSVLSQLISPRILIDYNQMRNLETIKNSLADQVRKTLSYRLGRCLLSPFRLIISSVKGPKKIFKKIIHKLIIFYEYCQCITYHYSATKYPNSFISHYSSNCKSVDKNVPRVIYTFWTGDNKMSENRIKALESIKKNSGVKVVLVTPSNLYEYILPEDPLPAMFENLSLVHKADYLRTYFMHHYGGGYTDIKMNTHSWIDSFDCFEKSNALICGYQEIGFNGVATPKDEMIRRDLKMYWRLLIGNGAYICRPNTCFTEEWYRETKKRVLEKSAELKLHPAIDAYGSNEDYPIPWTYLLGEVFHPLCLKYHKNILMDKNIKPSFNNYR